MRTSDFGRYAVGFCATAAMLAGCSQGQSVTAAGVDSPWQTIRTAHHACPEPEPGHAQCSILIPREVKPACVGETCGWGPIDFQTRYKLPTSRGSGQIVAAVAAYD